MAKAARSSPQRKQHARAGAISLESPASRTRSARNINPSSASDLASAFSKNPHNDLTYSESEDDYCGYSNDDASSSATDVAANSSGNLYHELLDAALLEDDVPPESFTDKSRKVRLLEGGQKRAGHLLRTQRE